MQSTMTDVGQLKKSSAEQYVHALTRIVPMATHNAMSDKSKKRNWFLGISIVENVWGEQRKRFCNYALKKKKNWKKNTIQFQTLKVVNRHRFTTVSPRICCIAHRHWIIFRLFCPQWKEDRDLNLLCSFNGIGLTKAYRNIWHSPRLSFHWCDIFEFMLYFSRHQRHFIKKTLDFIGLLSIVHLYLDPFLLSFLLFSNEIFSILRYSTVALEHELRAIMQNWGTFAKTNDSLITYCWH